MIEGGGGFGEIHTEEHYWDEMDGLVKAKRFFMELGGEGGEGWLNSLSDKSGHGDNGQGDHQMLKFCGGTFMGFIYLFF